MAKLSTEVTKRVRSSLFVISALREQGPFVANQLLETVRSSLREDDEPPEFLPQIQSLGRLLKTELDRLVGNEVLMLEASKARGKLSRAREEKAALLTQQVLGIKRLITGQYRNPKLEELHLQGLVAREPVAIMRQAEAVCHELVRDDLHESLGESQFEAELDASLYALQVDETVAELRVLIDEHVDARRKVDRLLSQKKEIVGKYDITFLRVARQFEDLCRLAGIDDLADKVRPSTGNPGQTAVPPSQEDVPEPEEELARAVLGESRVPGEEVAATQSEPLSEPGEPGSEEAESASDEPASDA